MRASQCGDPALEALNEILGRFGTSQSLVRNSLHDRKGVLDPMVKLAQQQFLLLFPLLALANVATPFEHQPTPFDRDELEPAVDRELALIFGLLYQFPAPAALFEQLGLELVE